MIVLLGLLTNLDGAEQAGGVRVSKPGAVGGLGTGWGGAPEGRGRSARREVVTARGVRLCVSHLLNVVILPKVMTEPHWDFHSAFRCS